MFYPPKNRCRIAIMVRFCLIVPRFAGVAGQGVSYLLGCNSL